MQRFKKLTSIKYKAAIIPHHDLADHSYYGELEKGGDCVRLDTRTESLKFIETILASEIVISHSLHGLIFAELFGKPSVWIAHTKNDIWEFKFRDWFTNTEEPPVAPILFGPSLEALMREARLSGLKIDRESLREALPMLAGPDRTGCMSVRECRAKSWITLGVSVADSKPLKSGYDEYIALSEQDEAALRSGMNVYARVFDDLMPAFLVFDDDIYQSLSIEELRSLRMILNKNVGAHYLTVLEPKNAVHRSGVNAGAPVVATQITDVSRASVMFRGVVLSRHMINFSFNAPGLLVNL